MSTVQQVIDAARVVLADAAKERYSDADLLRYLNDGIAQVHALRPDLRFPNYLTAPADVALGAAFPLARHFEPIVGDYIVFRAETRDDEHIDANRAGQFVARFDKMVVSA